MFLILFYSIGASVDEPILSRFANLLTGNLFLIGVLTSLGWGVLTIMSEPAGSILGKIGMRKTIFFGGIVDALGFLILYVANSPIVFAIAEIIGATGSALFWTASRTLIANLSRGKTGSAFGEYTASWGIGWSVGPLLGGSLAYLVNIRAPFLTGAIILLIAVFMMRQLIPKDRKKGNLERAIEDEFRGKFLKEGISFLKHSRRGIRRILLLQALMYALEYTILIFLPLYLVQLNNAEIGAIFFMQSIIFAVGSIVWGKLSDRVNKRYLVSLGFFASGATVLILLSSLEFIYAFIVMGLWGLSLALIEPLLDAMSNDRVERKDRGLVNGLSQASYGVGATIGPVISGLIVVLFGIQNIFSFAAFLCVVSGIISFMIRK